MNNLAPPKLFVNVPQIENLNFHTNLVGLPVQGSIFQVSGKMDIRLLRRHSWRGMKPSKPLPRIRRIPRLFFQLPPSASLRALTILNVTCGQFELPALDRMAIVPNHSAHDPPSLEVGGYASTIPPPCFLIESSAAFNATLATPFLLKSLSTKKQVRRQSFWP